MSSHRQARFQTMNLLIFLGSFVKVDGVLYMVWSVVLGRPKVWTLKKIKIFC